MKTQKHETNRFGLAVGGLLALLMLVPLASAATKFPILGEVDWGANVATFFAVLIVLMFVALFLAPVRAMLRGAPVLKAFVATPVGIVAGILIFALVGSIWVPGGFLHGEAATFGADDDSESSTTQYEDTSDVTLYAADFETKSTSIAPVVSLYPASKEVTDKAALEGSGTPEYTATMSSGSVTINGVQVQQFGCEWDIHYSLSGYYERIDRGVNLCKKANALGNNDVSAPTFYLKNIGTASLSKTDTSLTCAANTQCDYVVTFRNSEADSWLQKSAVKFSTGNSAASLDAVESGDCKIEEVSSTKYIVYTGTSEDIGPLGIVACTVKITDNAVTGGTFNLTADDNWQLLGASSWNTNSNVQGASATAATEVTLA